MGTNFWSDRLPYFPFSLLPLLWWAKNRMNGIFSIFFMCLFMIWILTHTKKSIPCIGRYFFRGISRPFRNSIILFHSYWSSFPSDFSLSHRRIHLPNFILRAYLYGFQIIEIIGHSLVLTLCYDWMIFGLMSLQDEGNGILLKHKCVFPGG